MLTPLFWLALVLAACDWAAAALCNKQLRWLTKPGTLLALLAWFSFTGGWGGPIAWFQAGLFFSLIGDILLMLPGRFFLAGGAAFFVTHVLYIAGFSQGLVVGGAEEYLPMIWLPAAAMLWTSSHRHSAGPKSGKSVLLGMAAAGAYGLVLVTMAVMGVSTLWQPAWRMPASLLAALGGLLFLASDSILAFDRFIRPVCWRGLLVMVPYHCAQFLIAAAALINFL